MEWLVLADDLTGACDTGGVFAGAGLLTRVVLDATVEIPPAQVLVATSESRHQSASRAAQAVRKTLSALNLVSGFRIYKKIDSTLRGQPVAELQALMDAGKVQRALVCPAFPAQGRTVRDGHLFVHGVPLAETVFWQEAAPEKNENLLKWFDGKIGSRHISLEHLRQGSEAVKQALLASAQAIFVADAETDRDLTLLAQAAAAAEIPLLCGSAGLARALAQPEHQSHHENSPQRSVDPVLVLAGSRNPATARQVAQAVEGHGTLVALSQNKLRIANVKQVAKEVCALLGDGKNGIISAGGIAYQPGLEEEIAQAMGELLQAVLEKQKIGGVVLTGGDIATAACRALDCREIELAGEVFPGMAWGWMVDGSQPHLRVITKAGGFGDANALVQAVEFLRG